MDAVPGMTSDRRGAKVRGGFKLQKNEADPSIWRLYHLDEDPGETTDVSENHPKLKAELIAAFNEYANGL